MNAQSYIWSSRGMIVYSPQGHGGEPEADKHIQQYVEKEQYDDLVSRLNQLSKALLGKTMPG